MMGPVQFAQESEVVQRDSSLAIVSLPKLHAPRVHGVTVHTRCPARLVCPEDARAPARCPRPLRNPKPEMKNLIFGLRLCRASVAGALTQR